MAGGGARGQAWVLIHRKLNVVLTRTTTSLYTCRVHFTIEQIRGLMDTREYYIRGTMDHSIAHQAHTLSLALAPPSNQHQEHLRHCPRRPRKVYLDRLAGLQGWYHCLCQGW